MKRKKKNKQKNFWYLSPIPEYSYLFGLALLRISGLNLICGIFQLLSSLFFPLNVTFSTKLFLISRESRDYAIVPTPKSQWLRRKKYISSGTACPPHISSVALLPGIFPLGSRLAAVRVSGMLLVLVQGTGIANTGN